MVGGLVTPVQSKQNKSSIFFLEKRNNSTPQLFFQGCQLEFVSSHKHLCLLFSDDFKWSLYIDNIVNHACKKLGFIKKLKFTLCRNKLSKMSNVCHFCKTNTRICFCGMVYLFNFGYCKIKESATICCKNCNWLTYFSIKSFFILRNWLGATMRKKKKSHNV